MVTEKRYTELFEEYDKLPFKAVSEQQLGHEILALTPDPTNASDFEKAELFAFQFIEVYKSKNAATTFYKHHRSRPLPDGTEQVYPDITRVTPSMIEYWQHRAEVSVHPVIKARYAGLVHEYSKLVSGKSPVHTISRMFAKALLDTVSQNLVTVFAYKAGKLQKALTIALSMSDTTLVEELKKVILQMEQAVPLTETKRFWSYSFDILLNAKKNILTSAEETSLVSRLEERMAILITLDDEAGWQAANRLTSYYHRKHDTENTLRVLTLLDTGLSTFFAEQPAFQKIYWLEKLYRLFEQRGFKADAAKFLVQIREESQVAVDELKGVEGSTTVQQSDIDAMVNTVLRLSGRHLFTHLAMRYSLDKTEIERHVANSSRQHVIYSIFTKDLVDAKGRKIGTLPPYHEGAEPYIIREAAYQITFNAIFLRFILEEGEKRDIITVAEIMSYVRLSSIFQPANLAVVERAFSYYMAMDYVGFIHTIIPQMEEAVRNLVEENGGNVLVLKDQAYMLRTFDHLLNDPLVVNILGGSTCLHLRALLTDKTGLNLRNDVAHGIIDPKKFNQQNADALMTAVLILVSKTIQM